MNPGPLRICLIEDDEILGEALSERFEIEGFACDWFKTGRAAVVALGRKRYDVALSDIRLPDMSGEEIYAELRDSALALPPFVFMTGYGTIDAAVRLLKRGAEDYLTKPFDTDALVEKLRGLCARTKLKGGGEKSLGVSKSIRLIESMLPQLAQSATNVLITGESGVGKEEVARALHRASDPEARRPFVAVNCGALTETLLEAELFGYEKGAFTGAAREKKGVFELADGGTLFLDEIGDMPLVMQVKLLRVIQERRIVRVGGETPVPVNIRLVCATHQDLKKMVDDGEFREDLYYRIHVIHLHVPPLRERKEDILWLVERLLERYAVEQGGARRHLHRLAEKPMLDYPWPGNIRELKHTLERACILSRQAWLTPELLFQDLPLPAFGDDDSIETLTDYLHACEKQYIEDALRQRGYRIVETAAALGISRKNLWEKMRKLGVGSVDGEA